MLDTRQARPVDARSVDGGAPRSPPSCSVVVTSYNKARYVGLAVESALNQTHPGVEVVVVDDGSTDDSVDVLRAYGDRIRLEVKPNGGQASATNRGVALSTGDVVFILDCDDLLLPDTVERVAAMWSPEMSKVHYRLHRIGPSGSETGGPPMPPYKELPFGDLSAVVWRFGLYPAPPSSGNAYSRRFLEQIMPIPEDVFRAWSDTYVIGMAPLFGTVGSLPGFGGSWRESETNYSSGGVEKISAKLEADFRYVERLQHFARARGERRVISACWPQHLKDRLINAKFGKASDGPGVLGIVGSYLRAVWAWPEYTPRVRARMSVWAMLMLLLPHKALRRIPGIAGPYITVS